MIRCCGSEQKSTGAQARRWAATTLWATDTSRWLPGNHFIQHDADARFGGKPSRSTEMIGYDAARRKFLARAYDDQGVSEEFVVALQRRRWTINGEQTRFNGRFDAQGDTLTGLWELKGKRGWEPWIRLRLQRA